MRTIDFEIIRASAKMEELEITDGKSYEWLDGYETAKRLFYKYWQLLLKNHYPPPNPIGAASDG